jgi:putative FmdB family regulatory protein
MPMYDYECEQCGPFSHWQRLADRNDLVRCPVCEAMAVRMISAPNLVLMPAARRAAHARNEKSRHEPGVTTRHRCKSGCGCGGKAGSARKSTQTVDLGKAGRFETARKVKRPWMLGH